ncbi:unnamed protein product [Protopolystoma xenopodis]|uniref:Uncharacterized protein n=1 Tax=Protopolystoma xenopodis TaxID=117903 RepID=A0A3S4ZYB2_9PLAT|nr:unnamed protein product [Protopolystoma xenopodis]
MAKEIQSVLAQKVGGCLVDCINLNVVLKPNGCSTTKIRQRLLVRLTYEALHHVLPYEMKVFASIAHVYVHELEENFERSPHQRTVIMRYLGDFFAWKRHFARIVPERRHL